MAAKKKNPPKSPTPWRARIRMYRQGLGDCFLLTFNQATPHHILIDCGVILGTPDPKGALRPVAEDIKTITDGKIDTLVITHEHLDHLWGFHPKTAGDIFDSVTFDHLWMAWTEDEKDDLANQLRKTRRQKEEAALHAAIRLQAASERASLDAGAAERLSGMAQRIRDVLAFRGIAPEEIPARAKLAAAKKTPTPTATTEAFDLLKKRIADKTYFRPGTGPFPLANVSGVRFYVLGPPHNEAELRKSAVTASDDVYEIGPGALSLADSMLAALTTHGVRTSTAAELGQPFEETYRVQPPNAAIARLTRATAYNKPTEQWRQIEDEWLTAGEQLALDLDDATNNTSLVLAFEFIETGEILLFVADAQLGNWYSWDEYTWEVPNQSGQKEKVSAADLLSRAIFYKVGHHGSHNATLRVKGLERMTSPKLVAMMPVDETVAHKIKHWMRMPLPSLCDRLQQQCASFIRLDQAESENGKINGRVQVTKLYVDYFV